MRIDAHAHTLPRDYAQALSDSGRIEMSRGAGDDPLVADEGAQAAAGTSQVLDIDHRIALLDAAEIAVQILSLPAPQVDFLAGRPAVELAMRCNDALAGIVQQQPRRFRALACLPLTADVDAAIREFERCVEQLGTVGVVIGSNVDGAPLDDSRFDPLYEELNRRGTTLFIHPTPPAEGAGGAPVVAPALDITAALARLIAANFFGRFLNISVLAAELGGAIPFLTGRLDAAYRTDPALKEINRAPSEVVERLYLDTTAHAEPALRCAIEAVGEDHLVFGSGYPDDADSLPAAIAAIEHAVARRHRGRVLGDTAARLFGLRGLG